MPHPLSSRLGLADDDFVSTFEAAARRNFLDANVLRRSNRRAAAIYLYGYSVEMRTKAAYFRFHFQATGLPPGTQITGQLRRDEADDWRAIRAPWKPGPHDIEGWANLLVMKRDSLGQAYAIPFANEVITRSADVYASWREYMRYRSVRVLDSEVRTVRSQADWFRLNYHLL
jgi:hypothetical protein